jgi:predicted transcriptional regulator
MRTISAKVSDEVYQIVDELATTKNISKSEVIKQAILNSKIEDTSLKKRKLFELNSIGNNLNQVARYCNAKKSVNLAVLEQLKIIEKQLNDL